MSTDQIGDRIQRLAPYFMAGDGPQFPLRQLHGEVNRPGTACVYDEAIGFALRIDRIAANQQPTNLLDGTLGRRQSDADDGVFGQGAEPFDGQGQMGASFVVGDGVYLVKYQGVDAGQALPAAAGGQQDVQGLGGSYQDMWRAFGHLGPL